MGLTACNNSELSVDEAVHMTFSTDGNVSRVGRWHAPESGRTEGSNDLAIDLVHPARLV